MGNKKTRNPLLVLFFTVFVDLLGFGILIPVIPLLLADPKSEYFLLPKGMTLDQGYIMLGFLTAIFSLMQFLATPILGQLSDKYGRKPILALSLFGTCLSYLIFAFGIITHDIPLLFISRAFDGITGGNISVAQAAIADITTPQNRSKNFGLIGAAFGLGFIVGPYIGGKLSDPSFVSWFNAATPFWFAAILSFINVLSLLFFLPETHKQAVVGLTIRWGQSVKNIFRAFSIETLSAIFLAGFLFQAGLSFLFTFLSVFLIQRFNFQQGNIGDFFAYVGVLVAFTQIILTRMLGARYKEYQILRITMVVAAITVFAYNFSMTWWQLYLLVPFFAIPNGLVQANLPALVSRSADKSIQGEVLGINASVQALAQAIPPMISGYIAAKLNPEDPIFVSAFVILISWAAFLIFFKPHLTRSYEINQ